MTDDDEHDHDPMIGTPFGPMKVSEWKTKQAEMEATTEANTRQVEGLFETLSKDDLQALHIMLVNVENNPYLVHYFLGMSKLALRMRFGDEEIMSIVNGGDGDDGSAAGD